MKGFLEVDDVMRNTVECIIGCLMRLPAWSEWRTRMVTKSN